MQKRLLFSVLLISLSGCSQPTAQFGQEPAGEWVDEQIRQSASSVSQAQSRLHQTSAVPSFAPVSAQVKPTAKAQAPAVKAPVRPVPVAGG
ncbi:putative lipoprotein [Pseudomonas amygdali pv. eriobotryae]|uniref:Putative lipoprotein n=3 Tax=Pseudomonas syringae group TaxID=136849 RepID=A0A0P9QZX4_PSEA0|nr:hypothetical protein AAY85_28190 [Pseudomonas amygdali pv. lachrymans]KPX38000.1 putative lipoprotein [Pseudomonas amygdali pv. eriobotryae]KWS73987.1 hypothetical protein AL052_12050 [Pseudomonas amygdali pv. eriobotryae]PWC98907.1 hypothetical protein CX658_31290 [Pseudomonas amygdali pv. lachrymans]RMO63771.1 putative lipoprotein [Pseudomonas amygdali pv. eriobotryae]